MRGCVSKGWKKREESEGVEKGIGVRVGTGTKD